MTAIQCWFNTAAQRDERAAWVPRASGPLPFEPNAPGSEFILAFQALPLALVMSLLTTLLFY